jgi:hypothetical protein
MDMPTKEGQICRILTPEADEHHEDIYVLTEDPAPFDADDNIYVVNLKDLQRNIKTPYLTTPIPVLKKELIVVANSLEEYVLSWNA